MCDHSSTSDVVYYLDGIQNYPLFDPNFKLSTETSPPAQCSGNLLSRNDCFPGTDPRLAFPLPDSGTSIEATPDNSHMQNIQRRWHTSFTGQYAFREQNEPTISDYSEICASGLPTKNHSASMALIIPQNEFPAAEIRQDQSGISPLSSSNFPGELERRASESLSQSSSGSPSQECYILWKSIPVEAIIVTGTNKYVPQKLYRPYTEADKERYLERATLSPPIIFLTKEPFEWGISLESVRNGKAQHLVDKDEPVLQDCGPSISIRINWPGYSSFKRQISSRNWCKMKGPITKAKLVQNLEKTTYRFIEKMSKKPLEEGAESSWRVGPRHIKVEDLILVSLHHVSQGSWQPQYRLRREVE